MKFPAKIRVCHATVSVLAMTRDETEEVGDGVCVSYRDIIKINTDLSDANQLETLWHELKHRINVIAGIGDDTREEESVSRSAPLEIAVLMDNPDLLDFIKRVALDRV